MSCQPKLAEPRTTWTVALPGCSCAVNRSCSSYSSSWHSAQFWAKAAAMPSTAGPLTRTWVSRHSSGLRASPHHSSAMPTPPVKAVCSSVTSTLRWQRWFWRIGDSRVGLRNQATWTPASAIARSSSGSISLAPKPSSSSRTRTPARARSARAAANSWAMSPRQYTKVIMSTVCRASRTAASIAGKIWSPLRSGTSSLPSVAAMPMSRSSRLRSLCFSVCGVMALSLCRSPALVVSPVRPGHPLFLPLPPLGPDIRAGYGHPRKRTGSVRPVVVLGRGA